MLTIQAPAKINLTLEVLGKRPDGFHEIRSVIQTVSLCDTLEFRPGSKVVIKSESAGWSAERSLVSKTVAIVRAATGCGKGVTIDVTKRIPLSSGLGGDSSDAAATLKALDQLWELGLSRERMVEMAAQLGSDVVFFLEGGTALMEGRGEKVSPLPALPPTHVLLIVPAIASLEGKTAALYASLNANHFTDGKITQKAVAALKRGKAPAPSLLFNTFENVAFDCFPGLKSYWEHLAKLGVQNVHLCGAGPALFALESGPARAEELLASCRRQGMEAYLAQTR